MENKLRNRTVVIDSIQQLRDSEVSDLDPWMDSSAIYQDRRIEAAEKEKQELENWGVAGKDLHGTG